jgi:hypothetical protein
MYYSYIEIEYVATSFSPARTDLALKLLNGVDHIYLQINLTRERVQLSMKDNDTSLQEGTDDIIDKVMAYKSESLVPNINGHTSDADDDVDNDMEDDNDMNDVIEEGSVVGRPCLIKLVYKRWKILEKMNVKKVRMIADERSQCKQQTTSNIMEKVMAMKEVTMTTTIPSECDVAEESEWTVYLRELRGNYYNET